MRKNITALILVLLMTFVLAGCGKQGAQQEKDTPGYKIGVVTPTLSTSEDEFRAADMMAKKYPEIVKHITLPENFSTEIETGLSQITSLADDPQMKAIIVISGQCCSRIEGAQGQAGAGEAPPGW
jgi:ABC-type sugar transport system substrate-binding protein